MQAHKHAGGLAVVVAIVGAAAGCQRSGVLAASREVTVSGKVTTVGFQTHPTNIDFVDAETRLHKVTAVSRSGHYSLVLPNKRTYNVTVSWAGLLGVTGTCNAGVLILNADSDKFDFSCSC